MSGTPRTISMKAVDRSRTTGRRAAPSERQGDADREREHDAHDGQQDGQQQAAPVGHGHDAAAALRRRRRPAGRARGRRSSEPAQQSQRRGDGPALRARSMAAMTSRPLGDERRDRHEAQAGDEDEQRRCASWPAASMMAMQPQRRAAARRPPRPPRSARRTTSASQTRQISAAGRARPGRGACSR